MLNRLLEKRGPVFAFVFLSGLLLLLGFGFQGNRGIWQPDEGYYTGTAVTMMAKDTLFVPYLGEDEIFLDKPPMVYWGIIAGLKIFGHTEFAVRFFHGLCFVLTALLVGALSYSMFKDKWLVLSCSCDGLLQPAGSPLGSIDDAGIGFWCFGLEGGPQPQQGGSFQYASDRRQP